MSKRSARIALLVFLVAGGSALFWIRRSANEAIPVDAVRVERGRVEQSATNSRAGTVRARLRAKLSPESGGRVVALPHRAGSRIAKGDVLVELDATLERGEVVLRERQVDSAQAEAVRACLGAERAERELERHRRLAAEALVSMDRLDGVESAAREAGAACAAVRAAAASARAALELARRALERRILRAPFDGVVAELSIEVGEWTTPSPPALPVPPVVDVLDPDSLYIELPMDEVDAGRLVAGLPARVSIDSQPGRTFSGRVVRVAPYVLDIEAQNRTVTIEVDLDRPVAAELLPGTSADVEVILASKERVLRIPAAAVLAGDRVLVVEDDLLVERRVRTGLRNWEFVEALDGVAEGALAVTSLDREEVRAGARVRVTEFEAPAAPAAAGAELAPAP